MKLYKFDEARAKAGEPCLELSGVGPCYYKTDHDGELLYIMLFSNGYWYDRNGKDAAGLGKTYNELFMQYPSREAWIKAKVKELQDVGILEDMLLDAWRAGARNSESEESGPSFEQWYKKNYGRKSK